MGVGGLKKRLRILAYKEYYREYSTYIPQCNEYSFIVCVSQASTGPSWNSQLCSV